MHQHFINWAFILLVIASTSSLAQDDSFKMRSAAELASRATALIDKARTSPTGESGEKLDAVGNRWILLMARVRTGESEVHEQWSDEIVVRSGVLTLVVGGEMTERHPYNNLPGEFHGRGLNGGTKHVLRAGDIAYVAAKIPHWMQVDGTKPVVVLVFKEAVQQVSSGRTLGDPPP